MAYGKKTMAKKTKTGKSMAKKAFKPCSTCPNKPKCRAAGKCLRLKKK
jgi:hypothetical protein